LKRIPLLKPEIPTPNEWASLLAGSYSTHRFSNGGPLVKRLESDLASTLGYEHPGVAVCNATLGLQAVLHCIDRGAVLCPSFTFPATACAIECAGHDVIIADVDSEGLLAYQSVRHNMYAPMAMVVVCPFGICPPDVYMEEARAFCDEREMLLLVDAAATLRPNWEAPHGLQVADAVVFSMHATKSFGIGEGGFIVSRNKVLLETIRNMTNFGFDPNLDIPRLGTNAKMSEFAAAVALSVNAQDIEHKEKLVAAYLEAGVKLFSINGAYSHQTAPAVFESREQRDRARAALTERGVETRVYYTPLHTFSRFKHEKQALLSEVLSDILLCLPLFPSLTIDEIEFIAAVVKE
jgi:dTDP-4-amino-4,6-dideoxygalactose transaminase